MHRLVSIAIVCLCAIASASAQTRQIALTFDDAPRGDGAIYTGDERAEALIATLKAADVDQAAFFVTTRGFDEPGGRERIERYAAAGHLIANHTHTHQWLSRVETDAYLADIDEAERRLAGLPNRRPWFRFPYLDEGRTAEKRDALRDALKDRKLKNGYVTVDNYDWYLQQHLDAAARDGRAFDLEKLKGVYVEMLVGATRYYDGLAVDALGRSPAHVILLHENDVAALFVDDFVAALRADGWEIVSPDVAYADPVAAMVPQTLITQQGHAAALAIDAGLDTRTLTHLAIEEAEIDALLEERGVFGPAP